MYSINRYASLLRSVAQVTLAFADVNSVRVAAHRVTSQRFNDKMVVPQLMTSAVVLDAAHAEMT